MLPFIRLCQYSSRPPFFDLFLVFCQTFDGCSEVPRRAALPGFLSFAMTSHHHLTGRVRHALAMTSHHHLTGRVHHAWAMTPHHHLTGRVRHALAMTSHHHLTGRIRHALAMTSHHHLTGRVRHALAVTPHHHLPDGTMYLRHVFAITFQMIIMYIMRLPWHHIVISDVYVRLALAMTRTHHLLSLRTSLMQTYFSVLRDCGVLNPPVANAGINVRWVNKTVGEKTKICLSLSRSYGILCSSSSSSFVFSLFFPRLCPSSFFHKQPCMRPWQRPEQTQNKDRFRIPRHKTTETIRSRNQQAGR